MLEDRTNIKILGSSEMNGYKIISVLLEDDKKSDEFPWKKHAVGAGFAGTAGAIGFGKDQPKKFRAAREELKIKTSKTKDGKTLWNKWIRSVEYKSAKRKCWRAAAGGASIAALYGILVYSYHAFLNHSKDQSGEKQKDGQSK